MLDTFTAATFREVQGDAFRLHPDDHDPIDLTLESVDDVGSAPDDEAARRPFALVFRGPQAPLLSQRTYRIEHDGLGTFALFLVPISADAAGVRYEAVFT